jgi:hypothetical protein
VKEFLRTIIAVALIWNLAGCGATDDGGTDTAQSADGSTGSEAGENERLLAQPPQGWKEIGSATTPNLRTATFIPEAEDESDWRRMIRFEAMTEDPLPDPIEFIEILTTGQNDRCGTFESYPTFSGFENGYPTSVSLLFCARDRTSRLAETTMIKTIQGNDRFYVITRALRSEPVEEEEAPVDETTVAAWSLYMKSVGVCDTARPEHPCPSAEESPGTGAGP